MSLKLFLLLVWVLHSIAAALIIIYNRFDVDSVKIPFWEIFPIIAFSPILVWFVLIKYYLHLEKRYKEGNA